MADERHPDAAHANELADLFCRGARRRVKHFFKDLWNNDDVLKYNVGQHVLQGRHTWMETDTMGAGNPPRPGASASRQDEPALLLR